MSLVRLVGGLRDRKVFGGGEMRQVEKEEVGRCVQGRGMREHSNGGEAKRGGMRECRTTLEARKGHRWRWSGTR